MDNSNQLYELIQKRRDELYKIIDKQGTLHPIFGREHIREEPTPQTLEEVEELAEKLARSDLEKQLKSVETEHPRFGDLKESVKVKKTSPSLASQLDDIGPQGSLLRQKLEEAGIDLNKVKDVSELKSPSSTSSVSSKPYIIPMDERAKIIDVDALKRADALDKLKSDYANKANKKALATLGKAGKFLGGGLGALAFASDMEDENEVAAAIDLAQTGLGLFGGRTGQAAATALETLRPSLTQTEEQEQDALKEHRFKLLKKGLAKKGLTPEI